MNHKTSQRSASKEVPRISAARENPERVRTVLFKHSGAEDQLLLYFCFVSMNFKLALQLKKKKKSACKFDKLETFTIGI